MNTLTTQNLGMAGKPPTKGNQPSAVAGMAGPNVDLRSFAAMQGAGAPKQSRIQQIMNITSGSQEVKELPMGGVDMSTAPQIVAALIPNLPNTPRDFPSQTSPELAGAVALAKPNTGSPVPPTDDTIAKMDQVARSQSSGQLPQIQQGSPEGQTPQAQILQGQPQGVYPPQQRPAGMPQIQSSEPTPIQIPTVADLVQGNPVVVKFDMGAAGKMKAKYCSVINIATGVVLINMANDMGYEPPVGSKIHIEFEGMRRFVSHAGCIWQLGPLEFTFLLMAKEEPVSIDDDGEEVVNV